ncbi:MAG: Nif3-like dinuclear metal center hexameric protein [Chloroflexota bacterium]|nr:Nif3-like dinuclear metal center hexameric protein [Chloroflexota bacterium]
MPPHVPVVRIAGFLDELLDVRRYAESELSNGLLLDTGLPVHRIAAAVNTSFAATNASQAAGAGLLLVHHATWASIDHQLRARKEAALRAANISLYAAHAALDCHPVFGNSDALARLLQVRIDGRFGTYAGGQAGVFGQASGSLTEFIERIAAVLGVSPEVWENSPSFGQVAILAGGGGWTGLLREAQTLGCDTYVTGEGSMYTVLYARETEMNLVLGTHYATEMHGIQTLASHVGERFGLPWQFISDALTGGRRVRI